ncbi:MAG: class I SAM-dependent methyltransferase [Sporocytophaga sp.]|nr:class I SAM-dependent methyltransferase [Sporocytophaga sp.]
MVVSKEYAWDCGTGNGQVAYELAKTFENVFVTDISKSQIDHARRAQILLILFSQQKIQASRLIILI